MWSGEFALSEFLSMLEEQLHHHLQSKYRRSRRYWMERHKRKHKKAVYNPRIGWGERRKEVEDAVTEIRRLREY